MNTISLWFVFWDIAYCFVFFLETLSLLDMYIWYFALLQWFFFFTLSYFVCASLLHMIYLMDSRSHFRDAVALGFAFWDIITF